MRNQSTLLIAAVMIILPATSAPLMADPDGQLLVQVDADSGLEQDEVHQALKSGLVRPLEDILVEVRKSFPGDIIEIEFEKDDGRFVYEIEMIRPDGKMIELKIDAKSMVVLKVDDD